MIDTIHSIFSPRSVRRYSVLTLLICLIVFLALLYVRNFLYLFNLNSDFVRRVNQSQYHLSNRLLHGSLLEKHLAFGDPPEIVTLIHQPASNVIVLRALLLFFPSDQMAEFHSEFRWFYRSWIEMMQFESIYWRTDLIIYTNEYLPLFEELHCLNDRIRENSMELPQCRVFIYQRVKDRIIGHQPTSQYQTIDKKRSKNLFNYLRNYGYIDSINTVMEFSKSYLLYDYILRTDLDCFLTINFALYVPFNHSIIIGHGGYSTHFNDKRLKRIAQDMTWKYADRKSLGSTWYGSPSMIHRTASYTIEAMLYLSINEFTTPEREQRLGVMMWPEWHYGVLLLYGGHLAINHLIVAEHFNIAVASQLLDQGVTSKDPTDIVKNRRLHLHCWHNEQPFSKFVFKAGKYNHINISTLVNDTSASGYAMRMALEGNTMTLAQLREKLVLVNNEKK